MVQIVELLHSPELKPQYFSPHPEKEKRIQKSLSQVNRVIKETEIKHLLTSF
jgi:hypothetical protein